MHVNEFTMLLFDSLTTHGQDLLEATSQELVPQMYPEVKVVRGGDQSVDQLHAGDLRRKETKHKNSK